MNDVDTQKGAKKPKTKDNYLILQKTFLLQKMGKKAEF